MNKVLISASTADYEPTLYQGGLDPLICELLSESSIRSCETIHYRIEAQILGTELLLRGEVDMKLEVQCARCAVFFSTNLCDSAFVRSFDLDVCPEEVDITPDIREAVILLLPRYPLCSENCNGCCQQCGTNWNQASCECKEVEVDSCWNALDQLKI